MTPAIPLLATLLAAAPAWRAEILSDDPAVRAPALARLHAKGRTGLYAVQDVIEKSADDAERARAVRALGELGDPGAEWELVLQLHQTSPHVLAAVVQAVGQLHLEALGRQVGEKVGSPDAELCAALGAAVKALPAIAERARALLAGGKGDEQLAALRVLVAAGLPLDKALAKRLIAAVNPEVRLAAAEALQASDPESAIVALAGLAETPQAEVAIETLGKIATPQALARLQAVAAEPAHAKAAFGALAQSAAGTRWLLARRAAAEPSGPEAAAIEAALDAQPRAPEWLGKLLVDPDAAVAGAAAVALASRPAGVELLGRCVENLLPAAERCAAGLAGGAAANLELVRALKNPETKVRLLLVDALVASSRVPSLELLTPLAVDPAEEVRVPLAAAVGRLDAAGVPLLTTMARDPKPAVRRAAAMQLVRLLPDEQLAKFVAEGMGDAAVRSAVLTAVGRLGSDQALRLLIADLGAPDAEERRQVMSRLAHQGSPEATQALMDAAAKDADPLLREYALTLLGNQ